MRVNLDLSNVSWAMSAPTEPIGRSPNQSPSHITMRFAFENQAEFPAFGEAPKQVRVTFRITAQDVQAVPGRHEWRNTVRARLLDVCPLAP